MKYIYYIDTGREKFITKFADNGKAGNPEHSPRTDQDRQNFHEDLRKFSASLVNVTRSLA